jgi:hypothetical protein
VPAGDQPHGCVVKAVEKVDVALAGHAEHELRPVDDELVDEQLAAAA